MEDKDFIKNMYGSYNAYIEIETKYKIISDDYRKKCRKDKINLIINKIIK